VSGSEQNPVAPGRLTSEGAAAAAGTAAPPFSPSLATLLASHILRDGELVLLILKPSFWFVLLSSLRFIAVVLILAMAAKVFDAYLPGPNRNYQETAVTIIAARLLWATLQWMGRSYILTDLRILCVWGVVNVELFDCPLRKVARTRLVRGSADQIVGVGSIEIIPQDESSPFGVWQTVSRPKQVHEQILATITRAKQGGSCV
jgi:Bacterial PH domain